MNRVIMKRGWKQVQEAPSTQDVLNYMMAVEADSGEVGPPDMAIQFVNQEEKDGAVSELLFMLAFHPQEHPLWLVQFSTSVAKTCSYLANQVPTSDVFIERTSCGVVERFRQECLLERTELVCEAIAWFLSHGTACPSFTWLPYGSVVRDVASLP
jgi:hypothetical protein